MKQKTIYLTAIIFAAILLISIFGVIADDQIRPAPQTDSRGNGEQIRPANQQSLPSDGNGNYQPSEGSSYSSSQNHEPPVVDTVNLKSELNSTDLNTTSNATGFGNFVLNTTSNELSYDIEYNGLSSNETGAEIDAPGLILNNETVSYNLPLGEIKQGIITLAEEAKNFFLNGGALVKIKSMLFPDGEVSGYIKII
jgi:hypothetical protein